MDVQAVLQGIRSGDRGAAALCRGASAPEADALVIEARRELPSLEEGPRGVVVACLKELTTAPAGELLLEMTDDDDLMVAAAAADALLRAASPPPADEALAAARKRVEPFLRGRLYRLAGLTGDARTLKALESVAESSVDAARDAQIAAVKLGGKEDRERFFERIETALPEQVLDLGDALDYVGDPKLARALLPWLDQTDDVVRLSPDNSPSPKMARMCDMAVLYARRLGIAVPGPLELDNYPPQVLDDAKRLLSALPAS